MKKNLFLLISFAMILNLFAQSAKSVGLSDSDVKNWAKNCISIQKEFEKLGIYADDTFSAAMNGKATAEKILQKYGISNPNSIDKYAVILQSAAVLKTESELNEQSKAMMQLMKVDPLGELKKNINSKDYNAVASNSKAVLKAVDELNNYNSSSSSSKNNDEHDMDRAMSNYQSMLSGVYGASDNNAKKEILKKYDTKKKFKIIKESTKWETTEWIIVQPSDITFRNSTEAELYAENYTGQSGNWCMAGSYGYMGEHSGKKPFYTWGSGGVLYYSKFPVDPDTGVPDTFIPDKEVTSEIAKKTILQMYKTE